MLKLIKEVSEHITPLLEEGADGVKRMYLEGTFMVGGTPNRNKRIYPNETLQREVARYVKENIDTNRAYGELGHPASPTINLDRVAIHIKSLKTEGNNIIGKAMVASTPMGDIVRGLINDGANLGVSSRGLGSLKQVKEGLNEVQGDFYLATPADVVADPSAPGAYVQGIMEGVEYWFDAATGTYAERTIEEDYKTLRKMTVKQIEETRIRMFQNFLDNLAKH